MCFFFLLLSLLGSLSVRDDERRTSDNSEDSRNTGKEKHNDDALVAVCSSDAVKWSKFPTTTSGVADAVRPGRCATLQSADFGQWKLPWQLNTIPGSVSFFARK